MSQEKAVAVTLPASPELLHLLSDIATARRRASGSDPGDRTDILRYESLCSSLEALASAALAGGQAAGQELAAGLPGGTAPYSLPDADHVTVTLTLPLEEGRRPAPPAAPPAPPPAAAWSARTGAKGLRDAARLPVPETPAPQVLVQRFRDQLGAAVRGPWADRSAVLSPSGIGERALTEALREYAEMDEHGPVRVPVAYRDGSQPTAPFPLRCLALASPPMDSPALLRLALVSGGDAGLDRVIDGAWLRDAEVSRHGCAGQVDDYAYGASARQLRELTRGGTRQVRLVVLTAGPQPAVVGFFRAVVDHLHAHPGTLEVQPMFRAPRGRAAGSAPSAEQFPAFVKGSTWAASAQDGGHRR